jgi:hypothetical protein
MQLRPGGTAVDNLFVRNSIALSVGGGTSPEPAGVTAQIHQNVILDGKNIDASNPRGWALWFGNVVAGHVTGNVVAHNVLGTNPRALNLEGSGSPLPYNGVHGVAFEDNVFYDWGCNIVVQGSSGQVTNVALHGNDVQDFGHSDPLIEHLDAATVTGLASSGNRFYSQQLSASAWTVIGSSAQSLATWMGQVGDATSVGQQAQYVDATRSVAGYNALIGGTASLAGFLSEARKQSAANWRPEYRATQVNGYIRDGFASQGP